MIDRRRFFLDTLSDLRERVASRDEYKTVGAAGLLRKLLMDEAPLLDLANRPHKTAIRFRMRVVQVSELFPMRPMLYFAGVGSLPEPEFPYGKVCELNKKQFLSANIIHTWTSSVNIGEFIAYQAHIAGGVHVQYPRYLKDKELLELELLFQRAMELAKLQYADLTGGQLRAIGTIVLEGLSELEKLVHKDLAR